MTLPALHNTGVLYRRILSQFPQDISLAFAYGSGVFKQHGTEQGHMEVSDTPIMFVLSKLHWHEVDSMNDTDSFPIDVCSQCTSYAFHVCVCLSLYIYHMMLNVDQWFECVYLFVCFTSDLCRKTCWTLSLLWMTRWHGTPWICCRIANTTQSSSCWVPPRLAPYKMNMGHPYITTLWCPLMGR